MSIWIQALAEEARRVYPGVLRTTLLAFKTGIGTQKLNTELE